MATLELLEGPYKETQAKGENGALHVSLTANGQMDAFHRLRVSTPKIAFDSQQEYGLCTRRCWDAAANGVLASAINGGGSNGSATDGAGTSVGPRNVNTRMLPLTVAGNNGDYAVLQSRQYTRYIPGRSHLITATGVFATGSGYTAAVNVRSSTSGSVVDTTIPQSQWNYDKLDGNGPSGKILDLTKMQILVVDAQWLGAGEVRFYFDIDGSLHLIHEFQHANHSTEPYCQTFNLPLRVENRVDSSGATVRVGYFDGANGVFLSTFRETKAGTMYFNCGSVASEGGDESRGFPNSVGNGITTVAVTTRRPVLSIRPKAVYNGLTNRAHIELADFILSAQNNPAVYEIVIGGALTGASWKAVGNSVTAGAFVTGVTYVITSLGTTNFTLIGAASNTVGVEFAATGAGTGTGTAAENTSVAEFDVSATAISGGISVISSQVLTAGGSTKSFSEGSIDVRSPLTLSKIDALAANQIPISIVCTSFAGTSTISANMNWHEQVI